MKHFTPTPRTRNARAFLASLLAYLLIVGQLTPLALAANASALRAAPAAGAARTGAGEAQRLRAAPAPAAPVAPAFPNDMKAEKTATFDDSDGDTKAEPGQEISYEVEVENTGAPSPSLNFTDTIDANTTLVPGSVTMTPLARDDTYAGGEGTQLVVDAASGVLANDSGLPAPTAGGVTGCADTTAPYECSTTNGGTVSLAADGSFTYDPPSGFTGTDSFGYSATNNSPGPESDSATVTISIDAAPTVTATTPADNATKQANNTDITITFSEPVTVTGNWFQIVCGTSGTRNVADTVVTENVAGDVYTINPAADFANGETCTVTVFAAQVADDDTNDPPDNMAADHVFDFTIDTPPAVQSTTPTNGATGVATNANITVTFDEDVTAAAGAFTVSCATSGAHTVVVSGGPSTFTLNPDVDFAGGEVCTVTVVAANVTDNDTGDPPNNMAANHVFSFTTDAAPAVQATTPTNGATDVPGNADITVTFTEPVNAASNAFTISCATSGAHTFALSGGPTTFTLNPDADFVGGELCTVTVVAANVTDQDGDDPPDNMVANFVFSFTIDQAPSVTATSPTNGATQQANNTDITVTFSEPVTAASNAFTISCATSGSHTFALSGGPTTFTLNPDADFTNGELCTVTVVAANVADNDGNDPPNNMAADFVFSFTIDLPPTVTTTVPTNGATGVAPNTDITVNFSEPVNASTNSFTIECPDGTAPRAFTLSASPSNSFVLDPTADLPEGVICTVTVIAAQITDTDAGDPPDNMAADFTFSFSIPPRAEPDARNATGNIRIVTTGRSEFSVLANDVFPAADPVTITAFDSASLRGGQVTMVSNTGTFSYNPPAGYEGTDTFNYTITNAAGSDTASVTITIVGMIWFIDDNPASGACTTINGICGRLTNPLTTLAAFEAANGNASPVVNGDVTSPEAGDHVFIYAGTYAGPLTLEANQRVVGQGATTGTLSALSGVTPAADSDALPATGGTKPTITTDGFNVVSNNQLYGLSFSTGTGNAVESIANIGTFIFGDLTVATTSGNGIDLDDGGAVTSVGTNGVSTGSGVAVDITNTTIGGGNVAFQTVSKNGNNSAITLANTGAGTFTVSGGTLENIVGADAVRLDNTDGRVTLQNMTIEDISGAGDATDGFNTRSGADAIHGQLVDGGLTLNNVTIRRISDSAINGTPFNNSAGTTSWVGLVLNNCVLENTNRFHVANRGDETDEGIVRILGLSGVVNVQNTEFENGARGLHIHTANSGSLDVTVQASEFLNMNKEITGQATNRVGNWGFYLRGMGSATAVVRLGDPAETNNALGNTFLNNPLASVVIEQDSSAVTGSIIASVARNTFTVTDHSSPDEEATNGIFDANFPQGGVLFRPFGGTIEAIFAANTFNDAMHANGGVGQLSLIADTGSDSEFIIRNNTFNGPWDFITEIRADGNTSCAMLWQNNSMPFKVLGPAEIAGTELADIGLATQPLPFEPFFTDVRNGGQLDLTIQNEIVPDHDRAFATTQNSFFFRTQASGGTLDLEMDNNRGTNGWRFNQSGGTLNLFRDGSAGGTAQQVLRDNGNRGGGVNPNTDPPTVVVSPGAVTLSNTDPTLPNITIPPQPTGPLSSSDVAADESAAQSEDAFAPAAASGETVVMNDGPVQHLPEDLARWAARRVRRGTSIEKSPEWLQLRRTQPRPNQSSQPAEAAPSAQSPAPAGRVWSDMPVVIAPAPRANTAPEAERDDAAKDNEADAVENGAAKESDSAKPAAPKSRVKRTETYRPQNERQRQEQPEPAQPGVRNISYVGPLGSAPARGVSFTRASYAAESGRVIPTKAERAAPAAKPAAKAVPRRSPLAVAGETVNVTIGTMPTGKSVRIRFRVTVNDPFMGAQDQVSNQGTVTDGANFTMLTDDPTTAAANDPTVTQIAAPPEIVIRDARVTEPGGQGDFTDMLFTVTLSRPAAANVTVNFTTSDGTATAGAGPQDDYTTTSGTLTFTPGQRVKTIAVPVRGNAPPEGDETLTVTLSNPSANASIAGPTATGTITETPEPPGRVLISELRTSGPTGPEDEFVEIYNNDDSPLTVTTTDGSPGWGLFMMGATCDDTPVLVGVVPVTNPTTMDPNVIPARGHFLFTGDQYSLANYGGTGAAAGDATLTADIPADANLALFNTTNVANLSVLTRLDAVGFGTNNQGNCKLLREGSNLGAAGGSALEHSYFRKLCGFQPGQGCQSNGTPLDRHDNATDFMFADTTATQIAGTGQRLGAPGPENLSSPRKSDEIGVPLLDSSVGGPAPPNRVRELSAGDPSTSAFGTMSIRRRVVNNTAAPVTRLRFRISELTTFPSSTGQADLRALSSVSVSVSGVNDPATCSPNPTPCAVTVQGTTLEQPPSQSPFGGGFNSTLSVGTVTLGTPLAPGASVNVQFLLGVQNPGAFRFLIVTEALP